MREGILDPHGPISAAERLILLNATGIMLVVVVPVILMTLAFAWWYRASNPRARYDSEWEYSGQVEMVVWSIPAMVVILLAGVGWSGSDDLDPARSIKSNAQPIRIQAISLDWKWLFIYPDQGIATVNQLVVRRRTHRVQPDLGHGHELVFRAAARQPDLHHARHDHPAQPAGAERRRLSGVFRPLQRGWILGHALHGAGR